MAATAYEGHAATSASKAASDNPDNVAPADAPGYNPDDFADEPGAAARANDYPRHDGGTYGNLGTGGRSRF